MAGIVKVERNKIFGEATVTYVGLTRAYRTQQYFLVTSDEGRNPKLKFPGLRFRATIGEKTLADVARERFEEQTGLEVSKDLGLRAVMPTRGRHDGQWLFRNIFFGVVENPQQSKNDGREVYVATPGGNEVYKFGNVKEKRPLDWVVDDNKVISRIANHVMNHLDWEENETSWYRKITTLTAPPLTESTDRELGCAMAISSMMLLYRDSPDGPQQIILLKRKGDEHPGYAGGKIETLHSAEAANLDPVSCCVKEGAEEFGFSIQPKALICVANTALDVPDNTNFYNSLVNYSFVAEPTNPLEVRRALKHPEEFLEGKMGCYVVESLSEHMDRIMKGELRMPDMSVIGRQFFRSSPGQHIPLTQFVSSGMS